MHIHKISLFIKKEKSLQIQTERLMNPKHQFMVFVVKFQAESIHTLRWNKINKIFNLGIYN